MNEIQYPKDFLKIWDAYPRKVGKFAAFKAFRKLGCRNGDSEAIVKSIQDHMDLDTWQRDHGQFIPHLSTFLNQRRFEDEI